MFTNIGKKIMGLASVIAWLGIIGSVFGGLALCASGEEGLLITGLMIAVIGALFSWISSFVLYGFGRLVDNTDKLVGMTYSKSETKFNQKNNSIRLKPEEIKSKFDSAATVDDKIAILKDIRLKGIISAEEYVKKYAELNKMKKATLRPGISDESKANDISAQGVHNKFCGKCGTANDVGNKFCGKCGADIQ